MVFECVNRCLPIIICFCPILPDVRLHLCTPIPYLGGINYMNMDELQRRAEMLKALSHPQRLCIIRGLITYQCNVGKIQETLGLTQSGLSQHISKLKAAGIIKGVRKGKEICYQVVDQEALRIVDILFEGIE